MRAIVQRRRGFFPNFHWERHSLNKLVYGTLTFGCFPKGVCNVQKLLDRDKPLPFDWQTLGYADFGTPNGITIDR